MSGPNRPQPLKRVVQADAAARRLSDAQWQRLAGLQSRAPGRVGPLWRRRAAMVSMLLAALAVVVLQWQPSPPDRVAVIADEVARNHLKQRPLEVRADDLPDIRRYFATLDFQLVPPAEALAAGSVLMGGRYCSVQGRAAAQFRYRTPSGGLQTLYEAPYDPSVHGPLPDIGKGQSPVVTAARGVRVRLWVRDGVLFARTGGD